MLFKHRRQYAQGINAFQVALRADANDQLSWVRLGELYAKAGRHAAAVRALNRATELKPDDWVCAYFTGEVQRQTGQFVEGVTSFGRILELRPGEPGVLMSLAQTHLDLGLMQSSTGYIARAEESFVHAIEIALEYLESGSGFRGVAWKTVGDALYLLSRRSSFSDDEAVRGVVEDVIPLITLDKGSRLPDILPLPLSIPDAAEGLIKGRDMLKVSLAVYDYRLTLGLGGTAATGSAWFDFAIALHALERATPVLEARRTVHKRAVSATMEAIRSEPAEPRYWRAFGDLNFELQARTAQHAYIRALELDNKVGSCARELNGADE
jgi:superkiller protein 3